MNLVGADEGNVFIEDVVGAFGVFIQKNVVAMDYALGKKKYTKLAKNRNKDIVLFLI